MDLLNFIFHLGVVLAVYNFLWWLIMLGIKLLSGGGPKQIVGVYFIKAVRYLFLADVIFIASIEQTDGILLLNYFLIAGLILLIYFTGRIQKRQIRNSFFNVRVSGNMSEMSKVLDTIKPIFNLQLEMLIVFLSMGLYLFFYFFSSYAYNPIANWFLENIIGIEQAPVFGFIFKIIGFFFLLSVFSKIFNGIMAVLTGKGMTPPNHFQDRDDDEFDDYTEVE